MENAIEYRTQELEGRTMGIAILVAPHRKILVD